MGQMILSDHHGIESAPDLHDLVPLALFSVALQLLSLPGLFLYQQLPVLTFQPLPAFSVPLLLDSFSQLLLWLSFSQLLLLLTIILLLVIV